MIEQATPKTFVSYSHSDIRIARRIFRRLRAHGIMVWMDERELRLGDALQPSLRNHIRAADAVIVIASAASASSNWVSLELAFANEHRKPIIPIFVDDLSRHERFRDYLGLRVATPQDFEETIFSLMRDLFRSFDQKLPSADPEILIAGLRDLAKEESDLAPLVLACLDGKGLHITNLGSVYASAFHPLDYALNALFDAMPNELIARHAGYGFCRAGAGTHALFSWIASTGDGAQPLITAVGEPLTEKLISVAIKLLAACHPPNNHALYEFIRRNAKEASVEQRGSMIRLATWPLRDDTARLGDVLGWVAFKHFPDSVEIQQMWCQWVRGGSFDRRPSSPNDLARYLADADKQKLSGWGPIHEALRSHVRGLLRSRDKNKVTIAIDHLQAAADMKATVLPSLLREFNGVSGTAEWNDWREHDPEAAQFMGWYAHLAAEQATGNRDWPGAKKGAEEMVEFEKERRRVLGSTDDKK